jgi:prophage antirepressor-like protein
MDSIVKFACEELGGATISCLIVGGEPYFKGVEVARVLGYGNTKDAI